MTESNGRSRRQLLGAIAGAATTALAGCAYRSAPGDRLWERTVSVTNRFGNPGAAYFLDGVVFLVERTGVGRDLEGFQSIVHRYGAGAGEKLGTVETRGESMFEVPEEDAVVFVFGFGDASAPKGDVAIVSPSGNLRTPSVVADVLTAGMGPDGLYVLSREHQLSGPKQPGDDEYVRDHRFEVDVPQVRTNSGADARVTATETGCAVAIFGEDDRIHVQSFTTRGERRWATDRKPPDWTEVKWSQSRTFGLELVDDALVYAGVEVVVFDAATGSVRATASGSRRPTTVEVDDATVYVGAGPTLHAFDRETWSKRWSHTVRRGKQWREADEDDASGFGKGARGAGAGAGSRVVSVADGVVFEVDDAVTELASDGSVRWERTFSREHLLGAHRNSLVFRRPDGLVARRR